MRCDGKGREKCWVSNTAENSDSGSGDFIYRASVLGM